MRASDFIGKRFGRLVVEGDSGERRGHSVLWRCRCDCGGETLAVRHELVGGKVADCGCVPRRAHKGTLDLTGRRFGMLLVVGRADEAKHVKNKRWHCKCDCGNEVDVFDGNLLRGRTRSCGCLNREQSTGMHEHLHYQDNTCIERLERVRREGKYNKAGFRGLFLTKNGKYRAMITFQRKHYNLGYFDDFDEAVQARLEAEEILQTGYMDAFHRYEERASADPHWASENPFFFRVFRTNRQFEVSTNEL